MPGPLQVLAVSFGPGSDFQGRILDELDRLQGRGVLRVVDLLFVAKDEDGTVEPIVVSGDDDLGALLSTIVPLTGRDVAQPGAGNGTPGFDLADAATRRTRWNPAPRLPLYSSNTAGRNLCLTRSPRPAACSPPRASSLPRPA